MAIAGATAGWCPAEVIFGDGGTMKPLLFGAQPGGVGVTAAFYARQGMTGPLRLLESKLGYFATAAIAASLDAAHGPSAGRCRSRGASCMLVAATCIRRSTRRGNCGGNSSATWAMARSRCTCRPTPPTP